MSLVLLWRVASRQHAGERFDSDKGRQAAGGLLDKHAVRPEDYWRVSRVQLAAAAGLRAPY